MCQILGYSKEELMGVNNRRYADKGNTKKLFQAFNKVALSVLLYKKTGITSSNI
jgi:hypothetical protein